MTDVIRIGAFEFKPDKDNTSSLVIEYPDGGSINTNSLKIEQIGIIKELDYWNVVITTPASLYKYKKDVTTSLELFGLKFTKLSEAITAHNILCTVVFSKKDFNG